MKDARNKYMEFITEDKYISKVEMNSFLYAIKSNSSQIKMTLSNIENIVELHNKNYIERKLIEEKEYFNGIFSEVDPTIKLDEEQRKAILVDEDYSMIIAGAGSGKTTTMAAKVKYLVEKKGIEPVDIIMISYTNKAIDELKERINIKLKIPVKIQTFHKLGMSILKQEQKIITIQSDSEEIVASYFKQLNDKRRKMIQMALNEYMSKRSGTRKLIRKEVRQTDEQIQAVSEKNDSSYYAFFLKCVNFLKNFKNNGLNDESFEKSILSNKKTKSFILLMKDIYNFYQQELSKNRMIDFEDMINRSNEILREKDYYNYKYIIIDEYQDISKQRFNLTRELSRVSKAKIVAVGDDWQAIFSFAGSDVRLFTKFKELMGYAQELQINTTYRNSQDLIDIAGNFVMNNKEQIKKSLRSNKRLKKPISIYAYNKNNFLEALNLILDKLQTDYGTNQEILIIGRYKFDKDRLLDKDYFFEEENAIKSIKYPDLRITFLTAHLSKGLGYDNVIIINAENGKYGFPSQVKDDEFSKIIKNKKEKYKHAEERRLFYVALTRSKNKVYILTPMNNQSVFVEELKYYPNVEYKKIASKIKIKS